VLWKYFSPSQLNGRIVKESDLHCQMGARVGTMLTKWNKLSTKPVRQIFKIGRLCLEVPGLEGGIGVPLAEAAWVLGVSTSAISKMFRRRVDKSI